MNKKVMAIVAVIALVAILGICLVACNADSVGDKLEKKGYTVGKLTEDSDGIGKAVYKLVKSDDGFKEGVFAASSSDAVVVLWFNDKDTAEEWENNKALNLVADTVERVGKVVYIGTEQGVKDAK